MWTGDLAGSGPVMTKIELYESSVLPLLAGKKQNK